ncbi:hypothetical protein CEXT_630521 [Caerostris extrusa]|uniref:Uncharacterized protein n=1 Tax=Caerostris extrusa TaxID=172846 RepID=A0AAV4W0W1_CAEEX|nr:hypothetical protein CEXT_630521 [Caerostris extrusa]
MANLQGRLAKFRRQKKAAKTLGIVVGVSSFAGFLFLYSTSWTHKGNEDIRSINALLSVMTSIFMLITLRAL